MCTLHEIYFAFYGLLTFNFAACCTDQKYVSRACCFLSLPFRDGKQLISHAACLLYNRRFTEYLRYQTHLCTKYL